MPDTLKYSKIIKTYLVEPPESNYLVLHLHDGSFTLSISNMEDVTPISNTKRRHISLLRVTAKWSIL